MEKDELDKKIFKEFFAHFHIETIIYDVCDDSFKYDFTDENGKVNLWKVKYTTDKRGLIVDWDKAEIVYPTGFNNTGDGEAKLQE
jgi:hypothetical protein